MKLNRATVQEHIYRLSLRFKENNYTTPQRDIITGEYFVDLVSENISEEAFVFAVHKGRKEWDRFPKIKEIITLAREYKPPENKQLEEMPSFKTPEQVAKNKEKIAELIKTMEEKMKVPSVTKAGIEYERDKF